ncbi:MAG: hypothetical protein ACR2QK_00380, partial [Acidimicrobiales bacterium]
MTTTELTSPGATGEPAGEPRTGPTGELVWLACELAGRHRTPAFIARLLDTDPGPVAVAISSMSDGDPQLIRSVTADQLRLRLIELELERSADSAALIEVHRHLAELAVPRFRHWIRLAEAATDAGDHRLALLAYEQAIDIVDTGTGLDDELGPGPAIIDATETVDRLFEYILAAAEAAYRCGMHAGAERHVRHAIRIADRTSDPNSLARVLALRVDPGLNVDDSWLGHFDRAWDTIDPKESPLAVELLRSQVYATYLSDPELSIDLAGQARRMADDLDDRQALVAALDAQRVAAVHSNSIELMTDAGRGLLAAARHGDREAGAKGYEALIFGGMLSGDVDVVERNLAAYSACAADTGIPRHQLYVLGATTLMAICRGNLDFAQERVSKALALATSTGDSLGIQMGFAQQAMIAIERDQMNEVMAIGDERLEQNPALRWWKLASLVATCRPGEEAAVADHLDWILPEPGAIAGWRYLWLGELVVLADAAVMVGDRERGRVIHEALLPFTDRYATLATAVGVGSVWRPVAALSAVLGDDERADRQFELAEVANRRIGAFPWLGRGRLRHAELLHRTGRSD